MDRVEGKVVLVTGAALGIGQVACLLLAREGARVAVTDVQNDQGQQVVDRIRAEGGAAEYWHMDVAEEAQVEQVFAEVRDKLGGFDALVNNAGITGVDKPAHELSEAEWDRVMTINVKGVSFCTKHAIALMRQVGGGSIINLSSIYGLVGAADIPPYHASKGAVPHFEEEEAYALPPLGLLPALSQGQVTPAIAMAEQLRANYAQMLEEHANLVESLARLEAAAEREGHAEHAAFARDLSVHAQTEEEVLYPTTLLIGEYLKLRLER